MDEGCPAPASGSLNRNHRWSNDADRVSALKVRAIKEAASDRSGGVTVREGIGLILDLNHEVVEGVTVNILDVSQQLVALTYRLDPKAVQLHR